MATVWLCPVLALVFTPSQTTSESINKFLPMTDILSGAPKIWHIHKYLSLILKAPHKQRNKQLEFLLSTSAWACRLLEYSEHKNYILFDTPDSPSGSITMYHILGHIGLSGNPSNNKIIREELYLTWIFYLYPKISLNITFSSIFFSQVSTRNCRKGSGIAINSRLCEQY